MAGFFKIILGLLFGALCAFALSPALAAFHSGSSQTAPVVTFVIIGLMGLFCFLAPGVRRAFGRGFLALGACLLFLPISALMLSGRAASEVISSSAAADQGIAAVGAGMGAAVVTGAATFLGLILGGIFIITGLVLALGGRREVIIVERK